jgi:hypothetical protein
MAACWAPAAKVKTSSMKITAIIRRMISLL